MGMAMQLCEREDHKIVKNLRGNVFGPLEFPRRDLMAINIQRGREHGLPDFNSARKVYNLPRVDNVNHFTEVHISIKEELLKLYENNFDNIDTWVGGILETRDGPGELFEAIIIDQFRRIRDGDRFWYENTANGLFTKEEIIRIKTVTLYDIIMAVTMLDFNDIQKDVFRVPKSKKQFAACNLKESACSEYNTSFPCFHLPILTAEVLNEACVQGSTFDYFYGSELSFILTFAVLGGFIVGIIGAIYSLVYIKQQKTESNLNKEIVDHGILAKEMINKKGVTRDVIVQIIDSTLIVFSEMQIKLRKIQCIDVVCIATTDKPYIVIKPRN